MSKPDAPAEVLNRIRSASYLVTEARSAEASSERTRSGGGRSRMATGYNRVKKWETRSIVAKVLIVDDEPNIREVVALYLRRDGHDVVSAADGEEALNLFRRTDPELVVLDLMLPKLSGLEVCRRMQAERRVPLIMLTARGGEEERIVGLSLGADDYVVKPFSPRELAARVAAVLRHVSSTFCTTLPRVQAESTPETS